MQNRIVGSPALSHLPMRKGPKLGPISFFLYYQEWAGFVVNEPRIVVSNNPV